MTHLFRLAPRCCCIVALTGMLAHAQPTATVPLPVAMPTWSWTAAMEASYGYNDNLLLSAAGEERSAFARGSVEYLLLRTVPGNFDYTAFLQLDGTHFFQGKTVNHEASAWLQMEPGYRFSPAWSFTLPLTGYYSDEVYDVSDTEVLRLVTEIKVWGMMAGPTLRWTFRPGWWVETQAVGERKYYEDKSNDGDVGEGALRVGWTRDRFEARLSGTRRWRDFVSRYQYTAVGRELPGTQLKIAERAAELRFTYQWDEARHWRTTTRANVLHYEDNASGYFNFREQKIGQELEWSREPWRIELGGTAGRIDYSVQTVGFGIAPPSRLRDEFTGELRIERTVSKTWKLIARYRWECGRSNDRIASYVVNEGLLGVRWSWDK